MSGNVQHFDEHGYNPALDPWHRGNWGWKAPFVGPLGREKCEAAALETFVFDFTAPYMGKLRYATVRPIAIKVFRKELSVETARGLLQGLLVERRAA